METYHIPALLNQTVEGLNIKPSGTYVDLTYGGGGHSRKILSQLDENGRLIVFDHDADAWNNRTDNDKRLIFVRHNFRFMYHFLKYLGTIPVDGILADLGVSSHHFDTAGRGFSFRLNGQLDMRMNQNATVTASTVLNSYSEEQLAVLFRIYGEISQANRLAREIAACRLKQPLNTTAELKEIASKFAPARDTARFLSQVFQALRIEVNGEMNALKEMLNASVQVLKKGGRLAVISYHSLEDRMVKNFFRTGNVNSSEIESDIFGQTSLPFKPVNRKVTMPDNDEIESNPRARSAKLRIAEKL